MAAYKLYLGLNDKDSGTQEIGTLEAYKVVTNLIKSDFGHGVVREAFRGESLSQGAPETMLEITIPEAEIKQIAQFATLLKKIFNQEKILLQEEKVDYDSIS